MDGYTPARPDGLDLGRRRLHTLLSGMAFHGIHNLHLRRLTAFHTPDIPWWLGAETVLRGHWELRMGPLDFMIITALDGRSREPVMKWVTADQAGWLLFTKL